MTRMALRPRTSCPLCGNTGKTTLISLPFESDPVAEFLARYYKGRVEMAALKNGQYVIDRCQRCSGMWQREILDDAGMSDLYERWISPDGSRSRRANAGLALQYARHCARLLRLLPDPGSRTLLDYGMGWGDWCAMTQSFGFRVHGVELSQERIAHARTLGIPCSGPEDIPQGPYDFLYLEQVLEHVPDPRAVMTAMMPRLKPSGYVHIGVPDASAVPSKANNPTALLRKGPAQPLEHINLFTKQSLTRFMHSFGCVPARQHEGLLRVAPPGQFIKDIVLTCARLLPAGMFPPGTSQLFRKS